MSLLTLPTGEAHLWYALPDELTAPALVAAYGELMAPEERERQRRYVFEKNRHEYLITRALARTVLSRYAPVAPKAWTFQAGHYGKPDIASPIVAPRLRFNLSNTTGLVACLVTVGREVGVDAEELERAGRALDVADRFFSPLEVRALRALPKEAQPRRFTSYWTLKEAYIKARGMGLSLPLEQFSFHISPVSEPTISFDPRLVDNPARWQFARLLPTRSHMVAAAVEVAPGERVSFVVRKTAPLVT